MIISDREGSLDGPSDASDVTGNKWFSKYD
jgi:hypothetical protein